MHRSWVLKKLNDYHPIDTNEKRYKKTIIQFVKNNNKCFSSSHSFMTEEQCSETFGHITGSAWILNPDKSKALLTHYRKLNKWLQLGGHSDDHSNVLETSLREAQ